MNTRYREKFGFPFILAVRGLGRAQILERLAERVARAPEVEFAECLSQIARIARFRLGDLIEDFITGIPKAELHIHIEGSLEPEMVFALARRHGVRCVTPA